VTRRGSRSAVSALGRRALLLAPLALAGCDTISGWFATKKVRLPGKRVPLGTSGQAFRPGGDAPAVMISPAIRDPDWPQAGGNPAHLTGNLSLASAPKQAWSVDLGEGGGKRRQLLAQPIVAAGVVYAMDSDAVISAFDLRTGERRWRAPSVAPNDESVNVGGGLCWDGGTLYAVNGVADFLALDATKGSVRWRARLDVPARSPPTFADGRIYLTTIDSRLHAFSATDGHVLWSYQASAATTSILGDPAPAVAGGIVVAGFGSGEVAALRADTGDVAWTDALGNADAGESLADFVAVRGAPIIANGQVFVTGMGGLTIAADVLTGRHVWERRVGSATSPFAAGNTLFLISTDQEVGAINMDDARIAWVTRLPQWRNTRKQEGLITWYGPIVAGDRVIVLGTSKQAYLLNPTTGVVASQFDLSDTPAPFAPVVADGTMLIETNDGRLTAWR
jgi:outer membrane protein assembly factor BamB